MGNVYGTTNFVCFREKFEKVLTCVFAQMSHIQISTAEGNIKIRLRTDVAPCSCEIMTKLVQEKHFDGCCFYRAEPNFVIQVQRNDTSIIQPFRKETSEKSIKHVEV